MSNSGLAARRDARKRRILENSQQRLSKIISCDTNRDDSDTTPDPLKKKWDQYNDIVPDLQKHERLGLIPSNPEPALSLVPDDTDEEDVPIVDEDGHLTGPPFPVDVTCNNDEKPNKDPAQQLFWVDCLFIVCLSVFVRLMYSLNMSSLFAEWLFIPFITISLAKIAANPKKRVAKPAMYETIIKASLLLSGVPKTWLDNCFLCIQLIIDIGNDLTLYLFTFVLTHVFLESFVAR